MQCVSHPGEDGEGNTTLKNRRYINSQAQRVGNSLCSLVHYQASTPNSQPKRGARRARQNKTPGSRGSITTLCGRQRLITLGVNTTGQVGVNIQLNLANLGDRPANVGASFLRYRYKWLKFTYRSAAGSAPQSLAATVNQLPNIGNLVMGVSDDVALSSSTPDDILNLRVSKELSVFRDASITWSPVDKAKWYYVIADSVGDPRFSIPAALFVVNDIPLTIGYTGTTPTAWSCGVIDLEYCIEYSGATLVPE